MKLINELDLHFFDEDISSRDQFAWYAKIASAVTSKMDPKDKKVPSKSKPGKMKNRIGMYKNPHPLDPEKLPKKPKKIDGIVVGPGSEPIHTPSPEEAARVVWDYGRKVSMNLAKPPDKLPERSETPNAKRKRAQNPMHGYYDPKTGKIQAVRPAGTYSRDTLVKGKGQALKAKYKERESKKKKKERKLPPIPSDDDLSPAERESRAAQSKEYDEIARRRAEIERSKEEIRKKKGKKKKRTPKGFRSYRGKGRINLPPSVDENKGFRISKKYISKDSALEQRFESELGGF